jgi:hypothetical protein
MTTTTLQVRSWTRTGGHHCYYIAGVGPVRAVELAHAADAAVCCQHVDYYSVHEDTHAAYDDPPLLIADYQGRPALTIRTDDWAVRGLLTAPVRVMRRKTGPR